MVGTGRAMPVAEFQFDVQGLFVGGFGVGEPPLFLGDSAELMVGLGLRFLIGICFMQLELGFMMCYCVVKAMLLNRCHPSEVVQSSEFVSLRFAGRLRVVSDRLVEELSPGSLLLCLVQIFLERRNHIADGLTS